MENSTFFNPSSHSLVTLLSHFSEKLSKDSYLLHKSHRANRCIVCALRSYICIIIFSWLSNEKRLESRYKKNIAYFVFLSSLFHLLSFTCPSLASLILGRYQWWRKFLFRVRTNILYTASNCSDEQQFSPCPIRQNGLLVNSVVCFNI